MARTRNLKPSFFTNEALADLSPLARLLFQGLWTQADREGRLEDRPKKLKAQILPYDNCDGEELLAQLSTSGFVQRYEVNGQRYLSIPTFRKHQNPHPKEPASVIPPLQAPSKKTAPRTRTTAESRPDSDEPCTVSGEQVSSNAIPSHILTTNVLEAPNGALAGESEGGESRAARGRDVFAYWVQVMNHPGAIYGDKRKGAVEARLKQGYTVPQLKRAVDGCRASPRHQGKNERNEVYDDLELICRNETNVDRFIAMADSPPLPNGHETRSDRSVRDIRESLTALQELQNGDYRPDHPQVPARVLSSGTRPR